MYKKIEVNKSARNAILAGHPWIFSGKIDSPLQDYENGEVVYIFCEKKFLGTGFVSPKNSIAIRVISKSKIVVDEDFFVQRFIQLQKYKRKILSFNTNMYRLVFSEADFIPGLIVDVYNRNIVIQTNCAGVIKRRDIIVSALQKVFKPVAIIDRTTPETYNVEHCEKYKLNENQKILYGKVQNNVQIFSENGMLFYVDLLYGHKTGFYLDQRENRELVGKISLQNHVLNLCSYSGGFTIYALANGAAGTVSVDISKSALDLVEKNIELNKFSKEKNVNVQADLFDFVTNENLSKYDVIVIDPPSFAKHTTETEKAVKAYKFLNSTVLKKVKKESFVFTSSCTSVVNEIMFKEIIEKAIRDSKRDVKIIKRTFLPVDHSSLLNFKETEYLKSFLLFVL
ncbi:MAG: class I SAM-dependent rRNA methyltransferase [candidate division WOR-3 bacterium]|jgi:23S rRNA (cytosine1962-C5)-methyltransferase